MPENLPRERFATFVAAVAPSLVEWLPDGPLNAVGQLAV
jgi:hypothetical protein